MNRADKAQDSKGADALAARFFNIAVDQTNEYSDMWEVLDNHEEDMMDEADRQGLNRHRACRTYQELIKTLDLAER